MTDKPSKLAHDLAISLNIAALPVLDNALEGIIGNHEIIDGYGLGVGSYIGTILKDAPTARDREALLARYLAILRKTAEAAAREYLATEGIGMQPRVLQ